jgi:hypothetical protein
VARAGDGGDARRIPRRRAQERCPADVDHLDRPVDADELLADLRAERPEVDDDEVDRLDALLLQLGELGGLVAAGEDAGVDGVVERLDLAVEHGRLPGELLDGLDLEPVLGEVLAGPVGGEELDPEPLEGPGEDGDAIPGRDRQQRSQPQSSVVPVVVGTEYSRAHGILRRL